MLLSIVSRTHFSNKNLLRSLPEGIAAFFRVMLASIVAAMVCGCASTSAPPLASLATAGSPPPGQARIVVMRREKGFHGYGDRAFAIKLDGEPMDDLMTGSFVYRDRAAGPYRLTAELWDMRGAAVQNINAAPGRTYYFTARLKEKVNEINMQRTVAVAVGGLAGLVLATAAGADTDETGPIELIPMSEAEAKRTIADISKPDISPAGPSVR